MAQEVLAAAREWFARHIFAPLEGPGTPSERVAAAALALDAFYGSGKQACLLNLLSQPPGEDSPFSEPIRAMFVSLIDAFAGIAREAGCDEPEARARAMRTVALLHGSLVLARGLNCAEPFRTFTASLKRELGVEV